ncbi:MAG: hypothetical protein ACYTDW_03100 [Planctomycetota bacterium]
MRFAARRPAHPKDMQVRHLYRLDVAGVYQEHSGELGTVEAHESLVGDGHPTRLA